MDDQSEGRDPQNAAEDALADCKATVEHLKDENAHLRKSAEMFGDLAERLNIKQRLVKGGRPRPKQPAQKKSLRKKG